MPTNPLAPTIATVVICGASLLLIMVRPRRLNEAAPARSVLGGARGRFVTDHAPCPVLLLRP